MKRLLAAIGSLLDRLFGRRPPRPPALPSPLSPDRAELEHQLMEYRRKLAEKAKQGTLS